jgi:hypothetical protein
LKIPPSVAGFLPEATPPTRLGRKAKVKRNVDELTSVEVRDFRLPLHGVTGEVFLRQIVLSMETMRISELWWALYDDDRRSDVWYFKADPVRNENKALSNYALESASRSADSSLELRVSGEMFRPQGAWWITGKVFSFCMHDRT